MEVFTAYIFHEDNRKLNEESRRTAQKGGSLFGQWTSTGNPVVHYAVSHNVDRVATERIGGNLWDGYRLCHIGEWRPVTSYGGGGQPDRRAVISNFRGGRPKRFLVLDVDGTRILPYLFENEVQKGRGKLEILSGENPFNRPDVLHPQQLTRQDSGEPRHYEQQSAAVEQRTRPRPQPYQQGPQLQEAFTTELQWYSGDNGSSTLQNVLAQFKKIAYQDHVEMSRDTNTHDISMSFIDERRGKKWEVKFPPKFPIVGAILIENPDSRSPRKQRQASNVKASQAVKNMITSIEQSRFY